MKDERFEALLKESLCIDVSEEEIKVKKERYSEKMKKTSRKRIVFAAVAACIALSITVYAAGRITGFISGTHVTSYENYGEMEKAAEDAGFSVMELPEQFDNGYTFRKTEVQDWHAVDNNLNTIQKFNELNVRYEKDGHELFLTAEVDNPSFYENDPSQPDPVEVRNLGGTEVSAYRYHYKSVPTGYEKTEEDIAFERVPGNYISYGSSEVEESDIASLLFSKDGIRYCIMDCTGAEHFSEMFEMAAQLLENQI